MPTLLIGAPTRGLAGVDADLDMVAAMVARIGLDAPVVLRRATLAVIRAELASLLERTRPGDRVFLYLTGHGGVVSNRGYDFRAVRPAPQRLHYFVTVPEADGREEGLFAVELSLWCARLAEKTPNVVVVIDACFSAGMVRDADTDQGFIAAFERWRDEHQDEIDGLDVEAHPDVVRLFAAGVQGVARPGEHGSALTTCLVAALAEQGAAQSSWLALFTQIEARLVRAGVPQEPRLAGPVRRRVFDLEVMLPPGAFVVRREGEQWLLGGGAQQGVVCGDQFLVTQADGERRVEVVEVMATTAVLRAVGAGPVATERAAWAFAVPLRLRGQGEVGECMDTRRRLAGVERLQSLGGLPLSSLGLRVSWGCVRGGICEPASGPEPEIGCDVPLYVRIENVGDVRRFISVFWIADDGEGSQLSRSEAMGVELAGKSTYLLGDRPFTRAPRGVVPPRRPLAPGERRCERLIIVATTRRQALWCFDTVHTGVRRSVDMAGTEVLRFTAVAPDRGLRV